MCSPAFLKLVSSWSYILIWDCRNRFTLIPSRYLHTFWSSELDFFGMNKCVACCFFEISLGVYFVADHTFFMLVSFCFEREVLVWCIYSHEAVMLWKPCLILKLGTDGSFEDGLNSGDVHGQIFKVSVSEACNSNALFEELYIVAVHSTCYICLLSVSLVICLLTQSGRETEAIRSCIIFPGH